MNIYYALTNYHLLCCILHSLKYHKGEHNVLYLSCWHPECEEIVRKIRKANLFRRVEIFREVDSPSGNKKITNKQILIDIDEMLSKIPTNFISDVQKSKEINIVGDHYCGSIYLVKNKISYNYFEDACGILSDEERLLRYLKNNDYSRYQIIKKLQLPGNHPYILNRFGDLNHQLEGYSNKKDIHFSVSEEIRLLSKEDIARIISLFSEEAIATPEQAVLFLTFHYVTMQLLSLEEQKRLYLLLVDYFSGGKRLVIKQHPSDIQPDYQEWFPDSVILPRKLPSELLPVLHDKMISRALTSYSTSIFSLKQYCEEVISFSANIEKTYVVLHKYYFILKLLEIFSHTDYEFVGIGMDESIANNIRKEYHFSHLNIQYSDCLDESVRNKKRIFLVDYISDKKAMEFFQEKVQKTDLVILFHPEDSSYLSSRSDFDRRCLHMAILHKEPIDPTRNVDKLLLKDESIVIYGEDEEFLHCAEKMKHSIQLKYSNLSIEWDMDIVSYLQNLGKEKYLLEQRYFEFVREKNIEIERLNQKIVCLENELHNENEKNEKIVHSLEQKLQISNHLYDEMIHSSSWKMTKIYRKIGGKIKIIGRKLFKR